MSEPSRRAEGWVRLRVPGGGPVELVTELAGGSAIGRLGRLLG